MGQKYDLYFKKNIHKNNAPEETGLDTNPSLTLVQALTLSTGERSLAIIHLRPLLRRHDC